jgi:hypothetical protein
MINTINLGKNNAQPVVELLDSMLSKIAVCDVAPFRSLLFPNPPDNAPCPRAFYKTQATDGFIFLEVSFSLVNDLFVKIPNKAKLTYSSDSDTFLQLDWAGHCLHIDTQDRSIRFKTPYCRFAFFL